jgi:hypothetical protein
MDEFLIYLKGGAAITVKAVKVDFPDSKSKILKIYISETETEPNITILAAEVAALVRKPTRTLRGHFAQGSARRQDVV